MTPVPERHSMLLLRVTRAAGFSTFAACLTGFSAIIRKISGIVLPSLTFTALARNFALSFRIHRRKAAFGLGGWILSG